MLGFLRRRRDGGKQVLGEAVTGIPAAPRLPVVPAVPEAFVAPAAVPAVPAPRVPDLGHVELGFRDGTTAVLEPSSAQARELLDLADLLRGPR